MATFTIKKQEEFATLHTLKAEFCDVLDNITLVSNWVSDMTEGEYGIHWNKFFDCLQSTVKTPKGQLKYHVEIYLHGKSPYQTYEINIKTKVKTSKIVKL